MTWREGCYGQANASGEPPPTRLPSHHFGSGKFMLKLLRAPRAASYVIPLLLVLALPSAADAEEYGGRIEPGLAFPLTSPQSDRFKFGAEVSIKGYWGLGRYLDVQAGVNMAAFGTKNGVHPTYGGTSWSDSLGLRLKRPHDQAPGGTILQAMAPWVDADALYVRTGSLDRFGMAIGVGAAFPLDQRRLLWLGPFVRYMQIVQEEGDAFDGGDARFLFVGAAFEFGASPLPPPVAKGTERAPEAPCPTCPPLVVLPSDRDNDGLADDRDNCPDVAGPNLGCPVYKKVVVGPDKLELKEKIFFAFDSAEIEPESHAMLDEVVLALKDNKGFRVEVEGHADSTGQREHNQTLSEQRAHSVLNYLREHGIASERLSYKGFGESSPIDSNKTLEGRENNRRVEFVVHFKILDRSTK